MPNQNVFSFNGRINKAEFLISYVFYWVCYIAFLLYKSDKSFGPFVIFLFIPVVWFKMAQSAKRCHDLNKSGWWQFVPLYVFWLLFEAGNPDPNRFGALSVNKETFYGADDYEKPYDNEDFSVPAPKPIMGDSEYKP